MTPEEIAAELGQPGAQELLGSPDPLRLAYRGADGEPWVIPIGFLWKDDRIVVCTSPTAPKIAAIRRSSRVAVTIDQGSTSGTARSVLIRGRAAVEEVEGVPDEYLDASRKGLDADAAAQFETAVRKMYDRMARITIEPTWARFYDFGAGRLPRTLQKLAERAAG